MPGSGPAPLTCFRAFAHWGPCAAKFDDDGKPLKVVGEDDSAPVFASVFVIVWCGAAVVTLNAVLLGGTVLLNMGLAAAGLREWGGTWDGDAVGEGEASCAAALTRARPVHDRRFRRACLLLRLLLTQPNSRSGVILSVHLRPGVLCVPPNRRRHLVYGRGMERVHVDGVSLHQVKIMPAADARASRSFLTERN